MNYHKKTINDVDVSGKKVLLRCDFNVPQDKETGAITSDKRIVASLPTIRALLSRGAAVIGQLLDAVVRRVRLCEYLQVGTPRERGEFFQKFHGKCTPF